MSAEKKFSLEEIKVMEFPKSPFILVMKGATMQDMADFREAYNKVHPNAECLLTNMDITILDKQQMQELKEQILKVLP